MKSIQLFLLSASLFGIFMIGMSFTSADHEMGEYFAADFRVSNIRTPGGMCYGKSENKVMVTVTNQGNSGYKQDIPVRLAVAQKGSKTKYYTGKVRRGFTGRDTRGQTVAFNNIYIKNGEQVTLTAEVNHDKSVSESAYGNNRRTIKVRPKGKCGDAQAANGKTLSVRVYDNPGGSPRTGLGVEVRKSGFVKNGNTGNNGTAAITNVPVGSYTIRVNQGTSILETRTYVMPAYNATLNIVLD